MRITFVRHGQSVSNAAGIWQGQHDAPLSALGEAQASALAERLAGGCSVSRIISSDLQRAHATAEALGAALGLTVEPDRRWREIDLGRWEGRTHDEVHRLWPDEVAALARGEDVPVGGGESWRDLGRRVGAAFEELGRQQGSDSHVLVVAHGGVIITLLGDLLGVGPARPRLLGKLTNTAVSSVRRREGRVWLDAYNDGLHVDEEATWRWERAKDRAVVELRAELGAGPLPPLQARLAQPSPEDDRALTAHPDALRTWAEALLPAKRSAAPAAPDPGSRCITTGARADGTLWTWNEGGGYLGG